MNEREYIGEVFDYITAWVTYKKSRYISISDSGVLSFMDYRVDGEIRDNASGIPFHNIKSHVSGFSGISVSLYTGTEICITVYKKSGPDAIHDEQEAREFFMNTFVINNEPVRTSTYYY